MKLDNITDAATAPRKRHYDDACGTAHALDLIGERWALLVMRELMLGPKRFNELRADLPGISANVLTQRLDGLEASGIVVRCRLPPPSGAQVYELTIWGYEAEPIVQSLGRWAARSPAHDTTAFISATSMMLSFRTMLSAERAAGIDAMIGFRLGEERFIGHLAPPGFAIARGDPAAADVIFSGRPTALAAAVYGGAPFAALAAEELLVVEGDQALARRFCTLFVLPPKAPVRPQAR